MFPTCNSGVTSPPSATGAIEVACAAALEDVMLLKVVQSTVWKVLDKWATQRVSYPSSIEADGVVREYWESIFSVKNATWRATI